jgi:hypothetical protein
LGTSATRRSSASDSATTPIVVWVIVMELCAHFLAEDFAADHSRRPAYPNRWQQRIPKPNGPPNASELCVPLSDDPAVGPSGDCDETA